VLDDAGAYVEIAAVAAKVNNGLDGSATIDIRPGA
jgi:hypothetical protein